MNYNSLDHLDSWESSILNEKPIWSLSSTSKHSNNIYIYLSKTLCKNCANKRTCTKNSL